MATILRPSLDRWVRGQQGQRYRDDFAFLSSRWVVQNDGTLAVSGGALRAATMGDWLLNLVTNGESWTGGPPPTGWVIVPGLDISTPDSNADPGASSVAAGAVDDTVLKLEKTSTAADRSAYISLPAIVDASYQLRALMYSPAANSGSIVWLIQSANRNWSATESVIQVVRDTWEQKTATTKRATGTPVRFDLRVHGTAVGDTGYFDAVALLRRNAPALLAGWRSPNHVATLGHVSPAAGVVPFGYITRYTDALNYWEVRVLPNTEGNDLQIIQVTEGAETVRAEADIDWSSDDTDELEVTCAGSTISTAYRKAGAGVWTAGPSYASATQGQTSPDVGVMLYEAGVGRLSGFDVRRA